MLLAQAEEALQGKAREAEALNWKSAQKAEAGAEAERKLRAANAGLAERVRGLEAEREALLRERKGLRQKVVWERAQGKENRRDANRGSGGKARARGWSVEAVPGASVFKCKGRRAARGLEEDLSLLLGERERDGDLFMPKFEHEEKLSLEVLKLKKQHLRERAAAQQEARAEAEALRRELAAQAERAAKERAEAGRLRRAAEALEKVGAGH